MRESSGVFRRSGSHRYSDHAVMFATALPPLTASIGYAIDRRQPSRVSNGLRATTGSG